MNKYSKYFTINNLKWTIIGLGLIFAALSYYIAYDPNTFLEEIIIGLATIFIIVVTNFVFNKLFIHPLEKFKNLFRNLVKGDFEHSLSDEKNMLREIQELIDLQDRFTNTLSEVKTAIFELENSNLEYEIENEENDILKESLKNLKNHLKKLEEDDSIRRWINEGLAKFADILRSDSDDLNVLSSRIIGNLVKYTDSNQAGLYIIDEKEENLEQLAFYAYEREKFANKSIPKGYNLLWQCVFEKRHIYMTDIPQDYVKVKSGLGGANPNALLLIPLELEGKVFGVIELASFNHYKDYEIEFLNKLAENIASTISVTKNNNITRKLLEESEAKTQELQQQEQFMRQNMEEMQSTQEEMERIQKELLQKEYNINALLNSSDDTFFAIDHECNISVVNKTLQDRYAASGIELKEGVNIFDCIPEDQHDIWKKRYDRSLAGEDYIMDMERKMPDGETRYLRGYYNCIRDNEGKVIGASVRSSDITEFNDLNIQIMDLQKELMELREDYDALKKSKPGSEDTRIKKYREQIKKQKGKKK